MIPCDYDTCKNFSSFFRASHSVIFSDHASLEHNYTVHAGHFTKLAHKSYFARDL